MQTSQASARADAFAAFVNRLADWLVRHWLLAALVLLGLWNLLPWLAPVFMKLGWEWPARGIYALYVLFCHQMPQRSWFLFGEQFTYRMDDILMAMNGSTERVIPITMRSFIGAPEMGWKVAWSDRMISFYGGWFLVGLVYAALRDRWKGMDWKLALLFMLPLAIDGGTHMISDLGGLREGFRETNAWLAVLTNNAFPPEFYAGDQWGSFNSIMRMITGILGAIGLIGFAFPYIDRAMGRETEDRRSQI
ncbi:MAG: DUF2085 domain-containing protein [Chloroflexi bacterium]|nr:DUF2085 domain-containing protein [Chloroflexota bacterium]